MSTSGGSKLKPKWKKGWSQPHEAFQSPSRELVSGQGLKFHAFSNLTLADASDRDTYIKETGLEQTKTSQNWGALPASRLYRSRRGSISGFTTLQSGEVEAWRLHSLPTSEALKDAGVKDEKDFASVYKKRADLLDQPWVNSKGTPQTANSVLSDIGKVGFDPQTEKFVFGEVTHASGLSGVALSESKATKRALYQPSIATAKKLSGDPSKEPRPESTFHSEPAALTLHNQHRTTKVQNDSGLVGAFASFPNQVCKQCGETFHAFGGEDSYISGEPGRPFGGQKVGEGLFSGKGATVFRATPARELTDPANTTNKPEVESIFKRHHVNRPKPALAATSISAGPQAAVQSTQKKRKASLALPTVSTTAQTVAQPPQKKAKATSAPPPVLTPPQVAAPSTQKKRKASLLNKPNSNVSTAKASAPKKQKISPASSSKPKLKTASPSPTHRYRLRSRSQN